MPDLSSAFERKDPAVLSLAVLAESGAPAPPRSHFEVLVRHLLGRFFHNEAMASEEDSKRAIQLGYLVALPGVLVALFLFPSYHHYPIRRAFWPQVGDHYFYVTYSLVVMGIVTVYQSDLVFPDLLDVFVLSTLPIQTRRLFFARIAAIAVFLGLVLLGCNSLGAIFLPLVADQPHSFRHFLAHVIAVIVSGVFASTVFLAIQGLLLNLLGARTVQRVLPFIQAGSISVLLTLLFLIPAIGASAEAILKLGGSFVWYFPPFWFLGIYQTIMHGTATLPAFVRLAHTGWSATLVAVTLAVVSYPAAYQRRVRQLIEVPGSARTRVRFNLPFVSLLHATVLRNSGSRAIFHFVYQSLFRTRRHRVLLAMYGGLALAMTLAELILLEVRNNHIRIAFSLDGVRTAIPILAFWIVAGVRAAAASPIDRRASWLFRVAAGRPALEHLDGAYSFALLCALVAALATLSVFHHLLPAALVDFAQVLAAIGVCVFLADTLFLSLLAFPFTELRTVTFNDLPLAVLKYGVLFPVFVLTVVHYESWMEASYRHLLAAALGLLGLHAALRRMYRHRVSEMRMGSDYGDSDEPFEYVKLAD